MSLDHDHMELLRVSTCGSVDDGKSTLIGRILYDSKSLFDDQLEALERVSRLKGDEQVNWADLTDGLREEQEQGITIDVAYRYFATPRRKFIVADTPGHVQYTRNMVTGASTANLALVLVDARNGVIEQTRRHSYIASLLGIPHLVVCINKMDLVDYSEARFDEIRADFSAFATKLDIQDITCIPISALHGEHVIETSDKMPWHQGPSLMEFLETVHIGSDRNLMDARFPVQYVIRPRSEAHHDYRGYAGQVASGVFHVGDEIMVLPTGIRSKIKSIDAFDQQLESAYASMSVSIQLESDVDIARGGMLVKADDIPYVTKELEAKVCWMHERPMVIGRKYEIKHTTSSVKAMCQELCYRVDVNTLEEDYEKEYLSLNEVGHVRFKLAKPLMYDSYKRNRSCGSFIVVDEATNATVGAGMIAEPSHDIPPPDFEGYVI
ncbi:MAG: sulfate adenylyltransferase subunit 1 [Lentisphaeria bacterium]